MYRRSWEPYLRLQMFSDQFYLQDVGGMGRIWQVYFCASCDCAVLKCNVDIVESVADNSVACSVELFVVCLPASTYFPSSCSSKVPARLHALFVGSCDNFYVSPFTLELLSLCNVDRNDIHCTCDLQIGIQDWSWLWVVVSMARAYAFPIGPHHLSLFDIHLARSHATGSIPHWTASDQHLWVSMGAGNWCFSDNGWSWWTTGRRNIWSRISCIQTQHVETAFVQGRLNNKTNESQYLPRCASTSCTSGESARWWHRVGSHCWNVSRAKCSDFANQGAWTAIVFQKLSLVSKSYPQTRCWRDGIVQHERQTKTEKWEPGYGLPYLGMACNAMVQSCCVHVSALASSYLHPILCPMLRFSCLMHALNKIYIDFTLHISHQIFSLKKPAHWMILFLSSYKTFSSLETLQAAPSMARPRKDLQNVRTVLCKKLSESISEILGASQISCDVALFLIQSRCLSMRKWFPPHWFLCNTS